MQEHIADFFFFFGFSSCKNTADFLSLIFVINICLLPYILTEIVVTLNGLILSCV
jgi:hypothetical protein